MYLHNQIGTVFRFNKDTATGGRTSGREEGGCSDGFRGSVHQRREGFGRRSHNPDGGLELCDELLHWEPRSPTCIFPTARADNWKQKLMTLQYAQPIYLLVFYLPDKMLGCSCMLYLLLSAALRRSCFI